MCPWLFPWLPHPLAHYGYELPLRVWHYGPWDMWM